MKKKYGTNNDDKKKNTEFDNINSDTDDEWSSNSSNELVELTFGNWLCFPCFIQSNKKKTNKDKPKPIRKNKQNKPKPMGKNKQG